MCTHVISADNSLSKTLRLNWDVIHPYISSYLTLSVVFCFNFSCYWIRGITSTILYLRREDVFYLTTSIISSIYTENHVIHGMIYNKNNERIYNTIWLKCIGSSSNYLLVTVRSVLCDFTPIYTTYYTASKSW